MEILKTHHFYCKNVLFTAISRPFVVAKENTTQTGGVFFGYDSMLRSYHLLVVRSTSVARWVSEGSAAGGG